MEYCILEQNIKEGLSPIITIDGPSGTGKGTMALRLARYLDWHILDSGALYRVLALQVQQQAISLEDEAIVTHLAHQLEIHFEPTADLSELAIFSAGQDITYALRTESCAAFASQLATLKNVRSALLKVQRNFLKPPGLVADGRDMGTIVFPNAAIKIFLTASPEERAIRRYKQLKRKGTDVNIAKLTEEIAERDERDRTRAVAPLIPAPSAHLLDTTGLSVETVMAEILQLVS